MAQVLIADDDPAVLWVLSEIFEGEGHEIATAQTGAEALAAVSASTPDLILLDVHMPGMDGLEVLRRLRMDAEERRISVVMMSDVESVKTAIYALRLGAFDYVSKPINVDELKIVVQNALRTHHLEERVSALEEQLHERVAFENIIGRSESMQKIYGLLERIAGRDVTVLILGESGTGKELIAQALHHRSQRRDGPFIPVDCGTLPENLIESELFGYERGAFTGAERRKPGKFELAHGGTLFFDEIGNISTGLQSRLLRALETGEVTRLGGTAPVRTDVRIISATNADIEKGVREGTFREDLFYRLNVITVKLPPLRERRDDIPILTNHFLDVFQKRHGKSGLVLTRDAMKAFYDYHWPGNVRELRNIVERAVILSDGEIGRDVLPSNMGVDRPLRPPDKLAATAAIASPPDAEPAPLSLKDAKKLGRQTMEEEQILRALKESGGNKTKAARLLGVSLKTLYNRIHEYGLKL
ncbi:MAG: sigma-54 dependent transcriptional regulator [Acidobacteriota bacterium]